jgi:hypothetical protein
MLCASSLSSARAQTATEQQSSASPVAGHYVGLSKSPTEGDMPLKMHLKSEGGNLTGEVDTQFGKFPITRGSYTGGRFEMKFMAGAAEGSMTGAYSEGRITGTWSLGETGGTLDLKRVDEATANKPDAFWPTTIPRLTKAEWREDLRYMAKELPLRHKNAFHTVTREQFERAVAELDAAIPRLRDDEILFGMARLTAMIGDGHTGLNSWQVSRVYPMSFYWFGDELRVVRTTAPHARALGARVVRIGDKDIRVVRQLLNPLISQGENEWFVRGASAGHLRRAEELHALGIVPDMEHAFWTFEDERGKRFTLELSPSDVPDEKIQWLWAYKTAPRYRQNFEKEMWFEYLPALQTVYFNFKGYPDTPEFQRRVADLFKLIDANPIKRLVIDMRHNGGGDFTKVRELLIPAIKQRAQLLRPGALYVVTGRATFSAAMVNAVDFKKELNATLVGEPTGARPNSYSENRGLILPNSHLTVFYSIRFYKFSEQDLPAVMPDKRIDPTWADFRAGRDAVLEWILAQPFKE